MLVLLPRLEESQELNAELQCWNVTQYLLRYFTEGQVYSLLKYFPFHAT